MKILRTLTFAVVLVACLVHDAAAAQFKIMIVTWRGCEEACQGFQDYLVESKIGVEFTLHDAGRKKSLLPGFLAEARENKVDLILTWGTSVTRGIAGAYKDRDNSEFNNEIPNVFTIVANPVGSGIIKSLEQTGRPNITGTYNRVPEEVNIETIRAYRPGFKRLGMLYNSNESNSVLKRDEVAQLTDKMGFDLISEELPLGENGKPRTEDIISKIAELKAAEVDFLYLGSSSFLRDNGDTVTSEAVRHGIPVISPYEDLVRQSQALISVAARYYDVGRLAGRQAEKILVDGVSPGDLAVARMTVFSVVINMSVAKKLKLFPSIDLLQIAETIK
ncbi:MAG: ABC transporter substrate-binding protein [Alphaproteobacteria bacterium]|nr:ABC transporter substrate-binding protein [Alphaproteobacteria bacterium]